MISHRLLLPILFAALCLQPAPAQNKPGTDPSPSRPGPTAAQPADPCAIPGLAEETDPAVRATLLQKKLICVEKQQAQIQLDDAIRKSNKILEKQIETVSKKTAVTRQGKIKPQTGNQDSTNAEVHTDVTQSGQLTPPAAKTDNIPTTPSPGPASTPAVGTNASQNAYATPNTCAAGTGQSGRATGQALLYVHRELLRQQDVEDDFGDRLGQRFLVYQVSITNASKDFQYEVGDISVDLRDILKAQGAIFKNDDDTDAAAHQGSSQTLDMLRGVPEKGQDHDPRNLTLHILQGVGSVGAAVSGLTPFSDVMGSAIANFNGAFIQAFTGIAPDHTATQLNRLSDMAFTSNTLVGKLQTKTFAIFLPRTLVLTKANSKAFRKDPRTLLNWLPLDQANVCVDGILLVQVAAAADPVLLPREANIHANAPITITSATPDAVLYYTDKGEVPTMESQKYTAAFNGPAADGGQVTIKSFAVAPNLAPSNVVVRTFTVATPAGNPTFKLDTNAGTLEIDAAANSPDDVIYYTTDGTTPDSASTRYTKPFNYTTGTTIKAVTIGPATSLSAVQSYP